MAPFENKFSVLPRHPAVAYLFFIRSESAFDRFRAYIEQLRSSSSVIGFGFARQLLS